MRPRLTAFMRTYILDAASGMSISKQSMGHGHIPGQRYLRAMTKCPAHLLRLLRSDDPEVLQRMMKSWSEQLKMTIEEILYRCGILMVRIAGREDATDLARRWNTLSGWTTWFL